MATLTNLLSGTPATFVPANGDVPADLAALVSAVPTPTVGVVANVAFKALTSNVATLTTTAKHTLAIGDTVVVAGVDATFNGSYTVTSVPSSISFTYAKTASNVTKVAATGTATETVTSPRWVEGAYLTLGDASKAFWNGSAWENKAALPDYTYDHNADHQPGTVAITTRTGLWY